MGEWYSRIEDYAPVPGVKVRGIKNGRKVDSIVCPWSKCLKKSFNVAARGTQALHADRGSMLMFNLTPPPGTALECRAPPNEGADVELMWSAPGLP
eukprot:4652210-Pyramimonas_sp.AAC.1